MEVQEYMTVKEYADLKDITVQGVYKQIKENRVKTKKIGTMYLVKKSA